MKARFSLIPRTALLVLAMLQAMITGAVAQDFSKLQCPTLIEVRIGLLVQYGYCPVTQFYAKRYAQQSRQCDPQLSEDDVEKQILNDPRVNPNHKSAYEAIMRELEAKRCDF